MSNTDVLQERISQEIEYALDDLFPHRGGGTITRVRAQAIMKRLAHRVASDARNDTLLSLKTSTEVAELYRCSRQVINERALRLHKQNPNFGWKIGRGMWVFIPEEVELLAPGPAGRPRTE